ncbi:interferon-induced transmembrane protein 3-like [Struthio camelus]|uniref:interferon-induced transmembrane protein 3-like n=1 Tax=Struthio camelus TaxID=8801 RepID=UPI00051E52EB|nr:PREDICTED: dispanin subfamily A member 2b-like [Struthio camelus australis]
MEALGVESVPSYKWWSIFNILCCCLPLGLVALYYSGQVEERLSRRDVDGARAASNTAKIINCVALLLGLVVISVVIFYCVKYQQMLSRL